MTQAQMDDLADLANTKMPAGAVGYVQLADPFEFAYIDNNLEPPANLSGELVYTGVSSGAVDSWYLVRVYTYKDVGGRRHYSGQYSQAGCRIREVDTSTEAHVHWTWDAVTGADGYIIVFTDLSWNASELGGYPTGNIVFPRWNEVASGEEYDQDENTTWLDQPPCGYGAWPRMLSWIHFWAVGGYTDAGAYNADVANYPVVSGPWVVSVGDTLRLTEGCYTDIEYWHPSEGDDITIEHIVEIANKVAPFCQVDSAATSNLVSDLKIKSADGGTLRLYVRWRQTGSATGWAHTLSITTGTATVTSETWTEIDDKNLELYAEIELTAAVDQVITFDVTAPDGTIMAHVGPGSGGKGLIFDESLWIDTDSGIMFWGDVLFDHRDMTPVLVDAIHPDQNTYKVAAVEEPLYSFYTLQGIVFMSDGGAGYGQHDDGPVLKASAPGGVWVATTKPVFAEHTFLDVDLPNYNWVRKLTDYAFNNSFGGGQTTMMRGKSDPSSRDGNSTYATTEVPVANVSSLYPAIRDTDAPPTFDYVNDYFTGGEGFVDRPVEAYTYQVMPGQSYTLGEDWVMCTVPQAGHCVFRVTVRLRANSAGVVPVATADTDVKIGTFLAAAFVEYETLTILTGESEASMDVFWPVLEVNGSFVGWQSDAAVDIFARVNFMPQMVSDFFPKYEDQNGTVYGELYGDFCGFPYRKFEDDLGAPTIPRAVLRDGNRTNSGWAQGYRDAVTLFQPSATIYNDTEAMLDLMP